MTSEINVVTALAVITNGFQKICKFKIGSSIFSPNEPFIVDAEC